MIYGHSESTAKTAASNNFVSFESICNENTINVTEGICGDYYYDMIKCADCGYVINKVSTGTAYPHTFGDWQVKTDPDCETEGTEYRVCSNCSAEETQAIAATGHSYGDWQCANNGTHVKVCENNSKHTISENCRGESVLYTDPDCLNDGYYTYVCDTCSYEWTESNADTALGHDYVSIFVEATDYEEAHTLWSCSRCDAQYKVLNPAVAVDNFVGYGDTYKINLSWSKSIEASVTGYRIYRKGSDDTDFTLLANVGGRETLSYVDSGVQAEVAYEYKIQAMKDDIEGEFSSILSVVATKDIEAPQVIKITPADFTTISKSVTVKATAIDNIGVVNFELYYSVDNKETWVLVDSVSGSSCSINFNTITVPDGQISIKVLAYDAEGNCSNGSPVMTYRIDNTAPEKVIGLNAVSVLSSIITLSWSETQATDVEYFILQQKNGDSFNTVAKIYDYLGYNVTGLSAETDYTFRVAAVDTCGNVGEYSDEFTVTTAEDTAIPVVSELSPYSGRYNSLITFSATAEDDCGIAAITIQKSTDAKNWTDVYTQNYSSISSKRTLKYSVSLANEAEGDLYLRAIATDPSGNISDQSETSPLVRYTVDKTAPESPTGVTAVGGDGNICISWNVGNESDISSYSVYRSESENGTYTLIKSGIQTKNHYDKNVTREITYYYKVRVTDTCGNTSGYSEFASAVAQKDTQNPVINSINPATGSCIGPNSNSVSVLSSDNGLLSKVVIEYKTSAVALYDELKTVENIGSYYKTVNATVNVATLSDGDTVYFRAYSVDDAGNKSDYKYATYTVDKTAPGLENLSCVVNNSECEITWTDCGESDLAGFKVYRSYNSGSYSLLGSRSKSNSHSYKFLTSVTEGNYSFRIDAVDSLGNINKYYYELEVTAEETNVIKAVITAPTYFESGAAETITAEDSVSDEDIVSYVWNFGDGTSYEGISAIKTYSQTGEYTITLTVTDITGNTSTVTKTITVKERSLLGVAKIKVVDANGKTLGGMPVYFDLGEENQQIVYTNSSGYATLTMPVGSHNVGVYKNGYLPSTTHISVLANATTTETIVMTEQDIVTGEFEVHEMTFEEIVAAGIDISDPANQQIYEVTVTLVFGTESVPVTYIRNNTSIINYTVSNSGGSNIGGTGGGNSKIIDFSYIPNDANAEIIAIVEVPVHASYLKQFYSATLHIINNASEEFEIIDCSASLDVPNGLAVVQSTPIAETIAGQQTSSANWILRGDKAGTYSLTATFNGTLDLFNVPVTASFTAENSVVVRTMEDTISILVETPEYIFIEPIAEECNKILTIPDDDETTNDLIKGNEYKYQNIAYVNVGMTNICDSPIYCPDISFSDDKTIVLYDKDGNPDENITVEIVDTFIEKDGVRTSLGIENYPTTLYPSETLINYYKISNISIATEAVTDEKSNHELEYLYCELMDHFVYNANNEKVEVVFDVNNQTFYDYYYSKNINDEDIVITYSTVKFAVDRTISIDYSDSYFNLGATEYHSELSELSLCTAMSGYSDESYSDAYTHNLSEENYCRATNIMKTYYQMGFSDMIFNNYNVTLADSSDKVASSMAIKYIPNEDGSVDTLVAVVLRGGGYGAEWASNFNVGSEGDHKGFSNAAKLVTADVHSYVANLYNSGKIKGNLKIWMTGYSRSAAVTNLTAHNLNIAGNVGGVNFDINDFYVYTFATPMGAMNPEESTIDNSNIFNIVSPLDFVPRVAFENWGYGRYGNTISLTSVGDVSELFTQYEGVYDLYSVSSLQSIVLSAVEELAMLVIPTPEFYEKSLQSTIIYALELLYSGEDIGAVEIALRTIDFYVENFELSFESVYVLAVILVTVSTFLAVKIKSFSVYFEGLKEAVKEILGDVITDLLFDLIKSIFPDLDITIEGIANAHYPTYYLAALQTYNCSSIAEFNEQARYKLLEGNCPVDLYVYDIDGNLVSNIVNNEVIVAILPTYVSGDTKYVFLDSKEYDIVWVGNDKGTMDYSIYEYDETATLARTVRFFDLVLEQGTTYTQTIYSQILDESVDYTLSCDGDTFETDYDSLLSKSGIHTITINNGRSTVIEAVTGEEVTIIADLRTDYAFVKWLSDVQIEDSDSLYTSFIMPDCDVTITATFEDDYISSLDLTEDSVDLYIGESYSLGLNVLPETADVADYVWVSSDETVATVDSNGIISACGVGDTRVTVTEAYTGLFATCIVTVNEVAECDHDFREEITFATCITSGIVVYTCENCGYSETEEIPALDHIDNNDDGFCDECNYQMDISTDQDCSCMCHKSGFMGFIWKILNFFYKLFGMNQTCDCGVAHW